MISGGKKRTQIGHIFSYKREEKLFWRRIYIEKMSRAIVVHCGSHVDQVQHITIELNMEVGGSN